MLRDHGVDDLNLAAVIGLLRRTIPFDIDFEIFLPAARAPACTACQKICDVALGTTAMRGSCTACQPGFIVSCRPTR